MKKFVIPRSPKDGREEAKAKSDSRISTEENSFNYNANLKKTSKNVQKFLLGKNDSEKVTQNNGSIKMIMTNFKEVKIKNLGDHAEMLHTKEIRSIQPEEFYIDWENLSDKEDKKASDGKKAANVLKKQRKKDTKFDWGKAPKLPSPETAFLKSELNLLDGKYYQSVFRNSDFRELARLNSGLRPATVQGKEADNSTKVSKLQLQHTQKDWKRGSQSGIHRPMLVQKEKPMAWKILTSPSDSDYQAGTRRGNAEETSSRPRSSERAKEKEKITGEILKEKIMEKFIELNYLSDKETKRTTEESPRERAVRLLEEKVEKNFEEIRLLQKQGLELTEKKLSTLTSERMSTSQKVESPGKRRAARLKTISRLSQKKSKEVKEERIDIALGTEEEQRPSDEEDERYSPTFQKRNKMLDVLGEEGMEQQKRVDQFYHEMLRSEGVYQLPLEGESYQKFIEMPKGFMRKMMKGTDKLRNKLDKMIKEEKRANLEALEKVRLAEFTKVNPMILNMQEILQLRSLYEAHPDRRRYDDIDRLLIQLKFFRKFNRSTRMSLLRISNLWDTPQGRVIQSEGDNQDTMYVIIRGSVTLIIRQFHEDGTHSDDRVASFYDGEHFGDGNLKDWSQDREQQLRFTFEKILSDKRKKFADKDVQEKMNISKQTTIERQKTVGPSASNKKLEKQKTVASTSENNNLDSPRIDTSQRQSLPAPEKKKVCCLLETAETSILLYMPGEEFKSIFLNLQKKELEHRLELLRKLEFLSKHSATELVPLANLLSSKIYKFGEIIIREGEIPEGAFLVSRGAVRVVKEELIHRDAQPSAFCRLSKGLRNMEMGLTQWTEDVEQKEKVKEISLERPSEGEIRTRLFEFQPKPSNKKGKLAYNDLIDKKVLTKGEFFCHRAINMVHMGELGQLKLIEDDEIEPARFTVLADSSTVELFILERKNIIFVPDGLKTTLKKALGELIDFDQNIKPEYKHAMKYWSRYKQDLSKNTFERLALRKGLFGYYKKL